MQIVKLKKAVKQSAATDTVLPLDGSGPEDGASLSVVPISYLSILLALCTEVQCGSRVRPVHVGPASRLLGFLITKDEVGRRMEKPIINRHVQSWVPPRWTETNDMQSVLLRVFFN